MNQPLPANSPALPTPTTIAARQRGSAYLLGPLVILMGIPVYFLGFDVAVLRSTGAATFATMALGVVLSLWTLRRDRRWRARIAAMLSLALTAGGAAMFFIGARLPVAGVASADMTTAPDFVLPDEHGQPRALGDLCRSGPVLLVFYRGHW